MKLHRIKQIIYGVDFHYILINHFKIVDDNFISNLSQFTLDFLNSENYLDEYVAENKIENKKENYLPFPFNIEKLTQNDFKTKNVSLIPFLENDLIENFPDFDADKHNKFLNEFKFTLKALEDYFKSINIDNTQKFSVISIDDFPHTSEKVDELYHTMNYIFDYFYFGIIPIKNGKEFITFELAYE